LRETSTDSLPDTLTVPRTDPIYNGHPYLTKVPVGAILPFIRRFSGSGEPVLDVFAGSGMTGVAAVMLGRNAELSDISRLGQHIGTGYLTRVDPVAFRASSKAVVAAARKAIGDQYMTVRAEDGAAVETVRVVWSFTYCCPNCNEDLVFFKHLTLSDAPPKVCHSCGHPFVKRLWPRAADVPVEVVVRGLNGRLASQAVGEVDLERIRAAEADKALADVPSLKIDEHREMFSRSGLRKAGITETKDFFSARNGIALAKLRAAISEVDDEALRQKLLFCFTASLARASRRYQWSRKTPLNAQNQTYYIAPVYYEWNIFDLFERKVQAAIKSDEMLYSTGPLFDRAGESKSAARYVTASASDLSHLAEESIDYVFTDPPFGSNIFYSDMNLFHEAWLGKVTDPTHEAVVYTTGSRKASSASRYEDLLRAAFRECHRVLKPGRFMSVVFGNSDGKIWGLVQRALRDCGFDPSPEHVAVLDKGQRSVKGLASGSESVATVDLILTVRKPRAAEKLKPRPPLSSQDYSALIDRAIQTLPPAEARNPSHVYARVLKQAIQEHMPLDGLHLCDVLVALKLAGYEVDAKTGRLSRSRQAT
jgi:16S rRNA G966 N2-methylase RsmD